MARVSWLDEETDLPLIDEHVQQLEHFTNALADGIVDRDEVEKQRGALIEAMRAVEPELSDQVHEKVTRLLVELTAYNMLNILHEMAAARARKAFS
jgi:hypothetical protein